MPFISSSELCSRIKALYRKTWYLNNPFLHIIMVESWYDKIKQNLGDILVDAFNGKIL